MRESLNLWGEWGQLALAEQTLPLIALMTLIYAYLNRNERHEIDDFARTDRQPKSSREAWKWENARDRRP